MTTIAFKDGVLSVDSRTLDETGAVLSDAQVKVFALPNGGYATGCGFGPQIKEFIRWLGSQEGERPGLENAYVVELRADGTAVMHFDCFACGSGAREAMDAMADGASAAEAVRIAALSDPSTGGSVRMATIADGIVTGGEVKAKEGRSETGAPRKKTSSGN